MKNLKVIDPFRSAINLVKKKLFYPFEPFFYLKLAFIAWLANMGQYGGFNFNFDKDDLNAVRNVIFREQPAAENSHILNAANKNADYVKVTFENSNFSVQAASSKEEGKHDAQPLQEQKTSAQTTPDNEEDIPPPPETPQTPVFSALLLLLILPFLLLIFAIIIFILWIISRGRMMFILALAENTRDLSIKAKWNESRTAGNSFFRYNLALAFLSLLFLGIFAPLFYVILKPFIQIWYSPATPVTLMLAVFLTICLALPLLFLIGVFNDFGPLLLIRRKITAWHAFKQIAALTGANILSFLKYYLFVIVVTLLIFLCLALFVLLTCCLCCLWIALLFLPFFWVLFFLPLLALRQYFIMEFAKQFGNDYNVYDDDDPAAESAEAAEKTEAELPEAVPLEDCRNLPG